VIGLKRGIFNCCIDVFPFKERIVLKDLLKRRTGAKQFKHVLYAHAQPADTRPSPAFAFFHSYPTQTFQIHEDFLNSKYPHLSPQTSGKHRFAMLAITAITAFTAPIEPFAATVHPHP
jgi:hypothetical protein